jgi:hypothetical protein
MTASLEISVPEFFVHFISPYMNHEETGQFRVIALGYWLDDREFESQRGLEIFLYNLSRVASETGRSPEILPLHRKPLCVNYSYQA